MITVPHIKKALHCIGEPVSKVSVARMVRFLNAVLSISEKDARPPVHGRCQLCGCTDEAACEGGCCWINDAHTLCSKCVGPCDEYIDLVVDLGPWIPVEDELPDDELTVLITNARWSEPVQLGWIESGVWHDERGIPLNTPLGKPNVNHHPETEPPTHWMDLPEPPEESEAEA